MRSQFAALEIASIFSRLMRYEASGAPCCLPLVFLLWVDKTPHKDANPAICEVIIAAVIFMFVISGLKSRLFL